MSVVSGRRMLAVVVAALLTGLALTAGAVPANASTAWFRAWAIDPAGRYLEGVTFTLEPGGHQQVTNARGLAEFTGFPVGEYLVSASAVLNGNCPVASSRLLQIDPYGIDVAFLMLPVSGEPACPPVVAEPLPALLGGVVLDYATYQPVEGGATVILQPGGLQTTTNEFGWYEFPGLAAGVYTVTATAGGGECGITASGDTVLDGQDQTLDLYLLPADCG